MKKTTQTTGKADTVTKKRIFYPARFYIVDAGNHVLKCASNKKDLEDFEYEDTDTILIGVHPDMMFESRKKSVTKIVLDFDKKELTLEGAGATIAKVDYTEPATYTLEDDDLKDWEDMIKDSKKIAKEFVMIGTPPIEGDKLDVE